ncbi:MAG TPA: leucyl aminopeptidase [Candidatus Paceibacterota bacterium]|jgi:leucyl aminopeptidase|nr:leucyl aminopeptidase [Candidatus Paceibacterota bacterium]
MKISFGTKPTPKSPFVFFLQDGQDILKYPLMRFLANEEVNYIRGAKRSFSVKEKQSKIFILPGTERPAILVGVGTKQAFDYGKVWLGMRIAVTVARRERLDRITCWGSPVGEPEKTRNVFENIAANILMANFEFVKYKTPPPEGFHFLKAAEFVGEKKDKDITEGLHRGMVIGEEVNRCRDLANTPGGDMTPEVLARHAQRAARGLGITAKILNEAKIKSLKMGGVLGVAKGSEAPPRFIILEYMHGQKTEKPLILVGKGVTFDAGGLNLKPGEHIYEMHMDMSGGAAVIHALIAVARLKLRKNIVALVPAVENMPSGESYRPGDVLRTMSGKTIEVLNTDAEGRVILSDALEYAKRYKPALVVDVATLTGAAMVALGLHYTGLFTSDKKLEERFRAIGEATADPVWPLPLSAEYEEEVKGTFGDWANTGKPGRGGGASTAAAFLWQFVKNAKGEQEYPWVHLDIAPRMTAVEGEYLAKGAAGAPVRLLVRLMEN